MPGWLLAAGEPGAGVAVGQPGSVGKTVLGGQGAQVRSWSRVVPASCPAAQAFDAVADEWLAPRDVIWGADADLLDSTEFAQPALFRRWRRIAAVLRDFWGASGLRSWVTRWRVGGGTRPVSTL